MNDEVWWRVGDVWTDGFEGATPTVTRGSETSLRFVFGKFLEAGGDYGDAYGEFYGGLPAYRTRYDTLRSYVEYNGAEVTSAGTNYRGEPWYRERDLPPDAPIDSFVVDVEPGTDVVNEGDAEGFWCIVTGGRDDSRPPSGMRFVELDVFVLAPLSDYDTRTDVEADLATEAF